MSGRNTRRRTSYGQSPATAPRGGASAQARARAISASINRRFPLREYGRSYTRRGTPRSLEVFGETFADANDEQRTARRNLHYYGRGMYTGRGGLFSSARKFAKKHHLGEKILHNVAGRVPYGSAIEKGVLGAKSAYMGRGQYSTHSNDLFVGRGTDSTPTIGSMSDETGELVVSHTEYIGDVYGNELTSLVDANGDAIPNVFQSSKYILNPGMEKTFPWLSQVAQNYQEYEFVQLVFKYSPSLADVSSNNGQVGEVLAVTQYTPTAPEFKAKSDIMQYNHYSKGRTIDGVLHGVECEPKKLPQQKAQLFVRNQGLKQGENINDYDLGYTQIAVSSTPGSLANASLGTLEVTYTVKLCKPIVKTSKGLGISKAIASTGYALQPWDALSEDPTVAPPLLPGLEDNPAIACRIAPVVLSSTPAVLDDQGAVVTPTVWASVPIIDRGQLDCLKFCVLNNTDVTSYDPDLFIGASNAAIAPQGISGIKLTFPAHYQGFVDIKLTINNSFGFMWVPEAGFQGNNVSSLVTLSPSLTGNISLVTDIDVLYPTLGTDGAPDVRDAGGEWFKGVSACSVDNWSTRTTGLELHCHVYITPATKAQDNTVSLFPSFLDVRFGDPGITAFSQENVKIPALITNNLSVCVDEFNASLGTDSDPQNLYVSERGKVFNMEEIPRV